MPGDYKFGIEEEYFLVDAETKSVSRQMPEAFLNEVKSVTAGQATGEMLQSQIEVMTVPHTDIADARRELKFLRQTVAQIAAKHGLAIFAAGTHPTATWIGAQQTSAERYDNVMEELQMIGQRNMLCGLHVHVELPDPDDRVDVMMRMLPYLPLFIALATSSPFWRTHPTGLKGYRLAAYDELPRTGVPELFRTAAEYDAYVAALTKAGVIEDSSYVWWAIRPSLKHPTLELRAPELVHAGRGLDRDRVALPHAGATPRAQSVAELGPDRGDPRNRRREQVARAALWRSGQLRRHLRQRRDHGRRTARPDTRRRRA